jgi:PEP-CTERM motif
VKISLKTLGFLLVSALIANADTISSNLSNATAGTEVASGNTWLTASFGTGTSSDTLSSVTLLLSNPIAGVAEVDLYSNSLLQPGSLVGTLFSPSSYSTGLSNTTFSSNGLTLSANSTYWLVLKALSGEFDWAWTSDNTGTGTGFQGTWGSSTDAGAAWYTYAVYPTQFSVPTTAAAVPEPGTGLLAIGGLLIGAMALYTKRRTQGKS